MVKQNRQEAPPVGLVTLLEQGKRERQEDAVRAVQNSDSSWMIAVADGTGGGQRTEEAAPAAVRALPSRIASEDEMSVAFAAANAAVRGLAAPETAHKLAEDLPGAWDAAPETTLVVASWTPEGGLRMAWVGDSMGFLVPLSPGRGWHSAPQRMTSGNLLIGEFGVRGVAPSPALTERMGRLSGGKPRDETDQMVTAGVVVSLLSDGAYKGYAGISQGFWFSDDPKDNSLGFVLPRHSRRTAESVAAKIMSKARRRGSLDDNASVVVARIAPVGS